MNVIITPLARRDLAEALELIASGNPRAAERVLQRIVDIIQQIAGGELDGPEVRLRNGRRVHRWSVRPYRIYYRRTARRTVIVRLYHQARRPIAQ